jgi:hypothetical protein
LFRGCEFVSDAGTEAADTEDDAEVDGGDEGGGTATTDERERLSGDGDEIDGDSHINKRLDDDDKSASHDKVLGKGSFASPGNHPYAHHEGDVHEEDKKSPDKSKLLDDDGVNEIGISLR